MATTETTCRRDGCRTCAGTCGGVIECDGYAGPCGATMRPDAVRWVRMGNEHVPLCDGCADQWRDDNFDADGRLK